ncbi:glycoside hydrolase family 99-like domain-containing protein [Pararhizobium sp. LjRoot255]|uniref:glycoside hydrolase family 99-like domain-containing protein n=1 Tax=Pararhizobium sp. LjRoot255 TaxID=3342298 RepID=UPI003ECE0E98
MASTLKTVAELWHPAMFWMPEITVVSAWPEHIPFAFWLTAMHRPRKFVELGTHAGASYFAFCQAIERLNLSTAAYAIDTWQGDEHAGHYGEDIFQSVSDTNSRKYMSFSTLVRSTFDDACSYFEDGGIDLLHIDGLHTYDAVKHDFETWLPLLSDRAIVLFHDTNVRRDNFGVFKFFEEVAEKYPSFKFNHGHGLGVLGVGENQNESLQAFFRMANDDDASATLRLTFSTLGVMCSQKWQLKHLGDVCAIAHTEIRANEAEKSSLRTQVAEFQAEAQSLRAHLTSVDQHRAHLESVIGESNIEKNDLAARAADLGAESDMLRKRLTEIDEEKSQLQEVLGERDVLLTELRNKLEAEAANRERLEVSLESASKEREQLFKGKVAATKVSLLSKMVSRIKYGKPNPAFDAEWYLSVYEDVSAKKVDPWGHFMRFGIKEGRRPHPLFEDNWYKESYPDVVGSRFLPFEHYHRFGQKENRAPYFDEAWYIRAYPDVVSSGLSAAMHYQLYGRNEGREPFKGFNSKAEKVSALTQLKSDLSIQSIYEDEYNLRSYTADDGRFYHEYAGMAVDPIGDVHFDIKTIAFYLPQMHPIPENDLWWGKGFTEWVNVSKAIPRFVGHYQPRLPGELGSYDLRCLETMQRQVELAKIYGLYAFCFYYYWFDGKRLLERPLNMFAENKSLDINFCICWANENWTRRWDGLESDILIAQNHSEEDCEAVFQDWLPYISDERYIRVDGKPLLLIYRPDLIPDFARMSDMWRKRAFESGLTGLHILGVSAFGNVASSVSGVDGTYDFPPHGVHAPQVGGGPRLDKNATTTAFSYQGAVENIENKYLAPVSEGNLVHPAALVGWDTEPRKPGRGDVFVGTSPTLFRRWLKAAFQRAGRGQNADSRFVFVNAWNEWAEGAYLEPDRRHGYGYLTALRSVVREFGIDSTEIQNICNEHNALAQPPQEKVVMLHLFYYDLVDEFAGFLSDVRQSKGLDLVVSFPELWSADEVRTALDKLNPRKAFIAENCGRDVYPFLKVGQLIKDDGYKYACKIHSKKSTHRIDGAIWRKNLLDGLLSKQAINQLKKGFFHKERMGMAAPEDSYLPLSVEKYVDGNIAPLNLLTKRFDISGGYRTGEFIAGTMFWFDFDTLKPIFESNLTTDDFGIDMGQVDGSLAHAFERFFTVYAKGQGKDFFKLKSSLISFDVNFDVNQDKK